MAGGALSDGSGDSGASGDSDGSGASVEPAVEPAVADVLPQSDCAAADTAAPWPGPFGALCATDETNWPWFVTPAGQLTVGAGAALLESVGVGVAESDGVSDGVGLSLVVAEGESDGDTVESAAGLNEIEPDCAAIATPPPTANVATINPNVRAPDAKRSNMSVLRRMNSRRTSAPPKGGSSRNSSFHRSE